MNFAVISVSLTFEWCEVDSPQGSVLVEFSDGSVKFYELNSAIHLDSYELHDFKKKLLWCSKQKVEQHIGKFNKPLWLMAAERARSA